MQIKKLFIALGIVLPQHMEGGNLRNKNDPEGIGCLVNQLKSEDN